MVRRRLIQVCEWRPNVGQYQASLWVAGFGLVVVWRTPPVGVGLYLQGVAVEVSSSVLRCLVQVCDLVCRRYVAREGWRARVS